MISQHRQEQPPAAPYRQTQGTDSQEHLQYAHECWHPRLIPGLERSYCPDCQRSIKESKESASDRTHSSMQTCADAYADMPTSVLSGACLEQSEPKAENRCQQSDSSKTCGCNRAVLDAAPDIAPDKPILSGAVNDPGVDPSNRDAPDIAPDKPILSGAVHWTEIYSPAKRPKDKYYRYMWMEGRYIRHRHILGGNIEAKLAKERLAMIERAIASGKFPPEIVDLIATWGNTKTVSEPMKPPMSRVQLAWALGDFNSSDLAWAVGSAALSDDQLQSISKAALHRLAERHQ